MSFTLDVSKSSDNMALVPEAPKINRLNAEEDKLSDDEYAALNYIEQHFWTTGSFPTADKLKEVLSLSAEFVRNIYVNPQLRKCMELRSLNMDLLSRETESLTAQQLLTANMVLNMADPSTLRQKLKAVGVSLQKYNGWMQDPVFSGYIRKRSEKIFQNSDADAYMGLLQAVQNQDLAAIKFYMELRGIYNPRVTVDVNITQVMVNVLEVITKHIDDPKKIIEIADDLEKLSA